MKKILWVWVALVLGLSGANAQESFKNRWWPNGDPIPNSAAPLQSTTTTTTTTPDKTITTTTSTPWGYIPLPPATSSSSSTQQPAQPAPTQQPPPVQRPAAPAQPPPAQPSTPLPPVQPMLPDPKSPQPQLLQPKPLPQKVSATNEIYAIVFCTEAGGCVFPSNGVVLYRSEDECLRIAALSNRGNPFFRRGDPTRLVTKCYRKTVNSWTATE